MTILFLTNAMLREFFYPIYYENERENSLLRPVCTYDFGCDFCRALQRKFCRNCKLAAISLQFRVRSLLQFPKNRC